MTTTHSPTSEDNYDQFVAELTALTRKYGIEIQSGHTPTNDARPQFNSKEMQMTATHNPTTEDDYDQFVAELTALARKCGMEIQSINRVMITDHNGVFLSSASESTSSYH